MKLSDLIVALLAVSGFMMGFGVFYGSLATTYGTSWEDIAVLNQTTETFEVINKTYTEFESAQTNSTPSLVDAVLNVPKNLWAAGSSAVLLSAQIPNFFGAVIYDTSKWLSIPDWATMIIYGVILVFVIAGIIKMMLAREF